MFSESNPNSLHSLRGNDFMPSLSIWMRLGGLFLVGTVVLAVGLASIIKYKMTVKAPATVRPSGELRVIQAATEGTIESIKIKENQRVKKGEVISLLDDSSLLTQKSQLQEKINQSQQQLLQISTQLSILSERINSESSLVERNIASARANLNRDRRDHQDRQTTTEAEMQEANATLALAKEELKRYKQLAQTGAVAQLQIEEKKQAFKAAQAAAKRAEAMTNPIRASVDIAQQQIAQEMFRGQLMIANLNQEKENLISNQIETQTQLNRDRSELQQLERELDKTVIKAPMDGKLLQLQLRNSGQVVKVGDTIAQISPQAAPLLVKARVSAQDISKVHLCLKTSVPKCELGKVQMRFSAYPYPDYGVMVGAVRDISADVITPQNTGNSNSSTDKAFTVAPYYEVTIEPDKNHFVKDGRIYPIQSGMEVTADIIAREETAMTFVLRKARLISDL
jgi:HlyD family type I secretion membrane fusion protein